MEQQRFLKLTITEGRNPYNGVSRILTQYNIICELHIGLGIYLVRGIPCDCIDFRNTMDLPWDASLVPNDQPRYSSVTK